MSKPLLTALLALGLLVAGTPAASAASVEPVCRTATGLLGGVLSTVGGLLSGLGLGRSVAPDCRGIPVANAPVPLVNSVLANLSTTCWRAAAPLAGLGLSGAYVTAARACGSISAGSAQGTWNALYGACAQAAPAIGAQGMVTCFRTVGQLKAIHDQAIITLGIVRL